MFLGLETFFWKVVPLANRDATLAPMFVAGAIYLILVGLVTVASKNIEKKFNYYK